MGSYRIGIDVGGTFTHAVALAAPRLQLVAQAKVPTTHRAPRGVAEGVIQALRLLLAEANLDPQQIEFLAYSTTQVTNALLEGDVAPVGIAATGSGIEGRRSAKETNLGDIALAADRSLPTFHTFLHRDSLTEAAVDSALSHLVDAGARALVAAEAFSVDDPSRERFIMDRAKALGLPASGTHEISGRYGLRVRTRTAVINASLLPKTIATADLTEQAARELGIAAPLMVVRSDGGVMTVDDMRRRPLLTLLSGPAAGLAAALMHARVSEGIFLEVGGTSTDISAIQHGRALLRTAEVGGHRLFLSTLDVRTIGVAGGSLPRLRGRAVHDVGPRSAHVAGLPYACFSDPRRLSSDELRLALLAPLPGDPTDYAVLVSGAGDDPSVAATLTCAANLAGQVPTGDFARGSDQAARKAFEILGRRLGLSAEDAARSLLQVAAGKAARVVEDLIQARNMDRVATELITGGGGASVLAPAVGEALNLSVRLAPNAPVISAIGTALALVREVVERTVPDATEEDVLRIRREAAEAVVRAGADPAAVTVDVEYDPRSAVLRAAASGQTELRERDLSQPDASDEEQRAAAAKPLRAAPDQVALAADAGLLKAYCTAWEKKRLFGLLRQRGSAVAVVDRQGSVRLVLPRGRARTFQAGRARKALTEILEHSTRYGDAGAELPQLFLGVRGRIVNLSGLVSAAQVLSLGEAELAGLAPDEVVLAVAAPRAT